MTPRWRECGKSERILRVGMCLRKRMASLNSETNLERETTCPIA